MANILLFNILCVKKQLKLMKLKRCKRVFTRIEDENIHEKKLRKWKNFQETHKHDQLNLINKF